MEVVFCDNRVVSVGAESFDDMVVELADLAVRRHERDEVT
jgi:hypothetical protein